MKLTVWGVLALSVPILSAAPVITSATPNTVNAGSPGYTVTVQGSSFVQGSVVDWAGTALATTVVSANQLSATVPASLLTTSGQFALTVTNPDASVSNGVAMIVNPVLSSISPGGAPVGSSNFSVTGTGIGFTPTDQLVFVNGGGTQWNLATTYVNSSTLSGVIPAAALTALGPAGVMVMDRTAGTSSGQQTFQLLSPTIGALSPNTISAGSPAMTLIVAGYGFVQGAVVQWNGSSLPTTFFSASQLNVSVSASLIANPGTNTITVISGGVTSNSAALAVTATPALTVASPNPVDAGGSAFTLTVTGTGFVPGSVVNWAGAALTTSYLSASTVIATVPASAIALSGNFLLTVTNPGGIVSSNNYTMTVQPVLQSISPSSAPAGSSSLTLTATGAGFVRTDVLYFTGAGALVTTFVNSTTLSAPIPAAYLANTGSASVYVGDSGAAAGSRLLTFAITPPPPPTITVASPTPVDAGGPAFTVTVAGSGFVSGSIVNWAGTPLTTTYLSGSTLLANVPASSIAVSGKYMLTVTNPGAVNSTNSYGIYVNPVLQAVTPNTAPAGGSGVTITATGVGFVPADVVYFNASGPQWPLVTTFVNSTTLSAVVPAAALANAVSATVYVINSVPGTGASGVLPFTIASSALSVTSATPAVVAAGGATFPLTITGSGFVSGAVVNWSGTPLTTTYQSATLLNATVPASLVSTSGKYLVTVTNPGGVVSTNNFPMTVTPGLTTITPNSAPAGSPALTVTATGIGFTAADVLSFGSQGPLSTTFVSSTTLTAVVPATALANAGSASVSVTDTFATSVLLPFTITPPGAPSITETGPLSVNAGGPAFTLTVNGSGFVQGSIVNWAGTPLTTTYQNASTLTASVPNFLADLSGSFPVIVTNPGGSSSSSWAFNVNPVFTSVTPASVPAGSAGITLTATGVGFVPSDAISLITTTRVALATTYVSPTTLTAFIPAATLLNPASAVLVIGSFPPFGPSSGTLPFAIAAPSITGLNPNVVTAGSPSFILTVTGSNFAPGSTVQWNGSPLSTTFVDAAHLTAVVPAALITGIGTASVGVAIGSGLTNSLPFTTVAAPVPTSQTSYIVNVASALPAIAPGSIISIYGSNLGLGNAAAAATPPTFLNGTTVAINNIPIPLLFASPFQINAQVPYQTPAGNATLSIQVNGNSSAAIPFTVTPTAPGVFTFLQTNHALVQNYPDYSLNSSSNPAKPGQYVVAYLTGQGLLDNPVPTGAPAPSSPLSRPQAPVVAKIGGEPATVYFAGMVPGFVGLLQMNVLVPNVPAGDQPFEVTIGGVAANPTVISVGTN